MEHPSLKLYRIDDYLRTQARETPADDAAQWAAYSRAREVLISLAREFNAELKVFLGA